MKKISLIFLFFILLNGLKSQDFVFEKITTRDGLSQNDVNCVFQDRNGFLWIGTFDGLNRYDGYSFKTYRVKPSSSSTNGLTSNLIFRIKEDSSGNLWIATSNEGVCRFDVKKEQFIQVNNTASDPNRLADNRVLDVECMDNGTVWVGGMGGINILSEVNGKIQAKEIFESETSKIKESTHRIVSDKFQRVWIGTQSRLLVCESNGKNIQQVHIPGAGIFYIRSLCAVNEGVFVGTSSGIFFIRFDTIDQLKYQIFKVSDIVARDIILDRTNNLFVAANNGLFNFSYTPKEYSIIKLKNHFRIGATENNLSSQIVTSLYEDASGIIWIGTNGGGLNKYNPKRKKFALYKNTLESGSLSHNKIRAIFEDSESNIWIGTEGGGINYLDHTKNRNFRTGFVRYTSGSEALENNVYSIIETGLGIDRKVWAGIGYPKRLAQFDIGKSTVPRLSGNPLPEIINSVFTMLKDKDENLWLGTYGAVGLFKYIKTGDSYRLVNYKSNGNPGDLSSNIIRSLLQDKQGNIWVGTDAGLNVLPKEELSKDNPRFKVFRNQKDNPNSLSNDYILPLFESKDGDIWVGTMGGGLNLVRNRENLDSVSFTCFNSENGLSSDVIKGILEDDYGFLWISSNKGLTRFEPKEKTFVDFDIADGLQDFEFGELACCKLKDGMMIFGGVNGFNTFYPQQIITDMTLPKVVFTDLQILNQSVEVGEKLGRRVVLDQVINHTERIKLKYAENSFAIYFSALHFSAPHKNIYKYMLEGFDQEWITKKSNERFAKYTNLKPGKYSFKLLASNNDGVWSNSVRQIEIIVVPPWWRSNLAMIVYIIAFVWLMWFFQKYSFIRIKQKNELFMERFEKEKMEELSQMKFRFFTNISHEFRTPLTLIIGSIDKLIRKGNEIPTEIQNKHVVIQRNASMLLRLINQLVDFRKFEQGKMKLLVTKENIVQFLENISSAFTDFAANKNIRFTFTYPKNEIFVWFDTDRLEKIVYNLLSNAIKFTDSGGTIELSLEDHDEIIKICVKDSGVGMSKEAQEHIFERFYQATKIKQKNIEGTGIGLSYSKGLAEMHHGDILFSSEEGVGSTFVVILKKGNSHFKAEELVDNQNNDVSVKQSNQVKYNEFETDKSSEPEDDVSVVKSKRTLLVVEDNEELRQFLYESFRNEYNVFLAEDGAQGLIQAAGINPDLIVSDIKMPNKDGFELCEEIKTNEHLSHIPVILLTAKISPEDTIRGYETGADSYIPKPFDFEILAAQVKNLILSREKMRIKFRKSIEVIPSEVTTTSMDEKFLSKILKLIEEHISEFDFTVEKLSDLYGMSQSNLNKKLKSLTGQTTNVFIRNIRLKRAAQLLKTGRYSVADVTYEVGFADLKYFRSCFKNEFGWLPSDYSKNHRGES